MPEHRMHRKTPLWRKKEVSFMQYISVQLTYRFHDAHRGSDHCRCLSNLTSVPIKSHPSPFRLQSAQSLFSGRLRSSRRVFACLSVTALSCLDIATIRGTRRSKEGDAVNSLECLYAAPIIPRALETGVCGSGVACQHYKQLWKHVFIQSHDYDHGHDRYRHVISSCTGRSQEKSYSRKGYRPPCQAYNLGER